MTRGKRLDATYDHVETEMETLRCHILDDIANYRHVLAKEGVRASHVKAVCDEYRKALRNFREEVRRISGVPVED